MVIEISSNPGEAKVDLNLLFPGSHILIFTNLQKQNKKKTIVKDYRNSINQLIIG